MILKAHIVMKEKISLKKLRKLTRAYPTRYIVFGGSVVSVIRLNLEIYKGHFNTELFT